MDTVQPPEALAEDGQEEQWDDNGEDYYDDEDEGDDDVDAEELARQLGAQLWQDIQAATVGTAAPAPAPEAASYAESEHVDLDMPEFSPAAAPSKLDSVLETMVTLTVGVPKLALDVGSGVKMNMMSIKTREHNSTTHRVVVVFRLVQGYRVRPSI
jgi:hypothetical protein